jgi:hypothetical protein
MVVGALVAEGGQKYLQKQARKNPVAFLGLVGRVLPLQLQNDGNPLVIQQILFAAVREAGSLPAPLIDGATLGIDVAPQQVTIETGDPD